MSDSVPVTVYVPENQRDDWQEEADAMDMSQSEFVASMTNAGRKKFNVEIEPDESDEDLREARNYLRRELKNERRKTERLEDQLYGGERQAITNFVEANPGASYQEIVEHVVDTVPNRVSNCLEELNGQSIWNGQDGFYPITDDEEEE